MSPGVLRKSMAQKIKNETERGGELTTAPVNAPAASGVTSLRDSEFFRLPKPGTRNPLSNLSRTSILEYGEAGCFKLIRLRKRGAARGVVLVDTKSFLAWLHGQPAVTKESQP
jgi:hypothetical protein